MAKIIKPQDADIRFNRSLSIEGAGSVGRSQAAVGNAVQSAGEAYFKEAQQSIKTSLYSRAFTQANEEFNQRVQERYQQTTDEDGNPNFERLPEDIRKIGDEVKLKYSGKLFDSDVNQQFRLNFSKVTSNEHIASLSQARKQQLDFGRATLNEALSSLTDQAIRVNPTQAEEFKSQAKDLLDSQLAGGLIDFEEHQALLSNSIDTIDIETWRNNIKEEPSVSLATLTSMSADDIGIKENVRKKLVNEAQRAVDDLKRQEERLEREQEALAKQTSAIRVAELEAGMAAGTVGFKEIEESREGVGELNYWRLIEKGIKLEESRKNKIDVVNDIAEQVKAGKYVGGLKGSDLDKYYNAAVSLLTPPEGEEVPTLLQKAQLVAKKVLGPIPAFTRELEANALSSRPQDSEMALRAFSDIKQTNPAAISKMSKSAFNLLSIADHYTANTNLPHSEAIKRAREIILSPNKVDPDIVASKLKEFQKDGGLRDSDIRDFILDQDIFDTAFFSNKMAGNVIPRVKELMINNYKALTKSESNLDNLDLIKSITLNQLSTTLGTTEFNGTEIMFFPPEKVVPDVPYEDIKENLTLLLQDNIDPALTADDIVIESDGLTRVSSDGGSNISYALYRRDPSTSDLIPIVNENGQAVRWNIERNELSNFSKDRLLERAQQEQMKLKGQDPKLQLKSGNPILDAKIEKLTSPQASASALDAIINGQDLFKQYGLVTDRQINMFLAQISHESAGFSEMVEKGSSTYFRRYAPGTNLGKNLGNVQPGDGERFKGRGFIQLTGRWNYQNMSDKLGIDLVGNPDLAADPRIALRIALEWFKGHGLIEKSKTHSVTEISRIINAGPGGRTSAIRGLGDRIRRFKAIHDTR